MMASGSAYQPFRIKLPEVFITFYAEIFKKNKDSKITKIDFMMAVFTF
jgi:hypothetical protein